MDDLAKLGIKVDASEAEAASKLMDKLTASAKGTATSAELVETAFKQLAVVLGPAVVVHALIEAAEHAYALQESYQRLAEVAGTLPSQMASLDLPARLAGTSLDSVAAAVARLSRTIGEAQTASGGNQRSILKIMGIDPSQQSVDPVERFVQLSKVIMGMTDANVQAYASQTLLGRSFAEMRPVMKEIIQQGGLHKTLTDEQIHAAKEFQDQLTKLRFELEQGRIAVANDYLPQLHDIALAFREGYKEAGLFTAAIRAFQMAFVGSDLHNANKEIVEFTSKLVAAQNQLQKLKHEDAVNTDPERPNFNARAIAEQQAYINGLQKMLDARLAFKKGIEEADKVGGEGGKKVVPDGPDETAIAAVIAEANLKRKMEDDRLYDERVAAVKGFAERYSVAVDTLNKLIDESHKRSEMTEEAATKAISANENAKLQVYAQSYKELERLAANHNDLGKAKEAQEAQAKTNAAIVANEAITAAKLSSIAYVKIKAYDDFRKAAFDAGEDVFAQTQSAEEQERKSYQKRLAQLEVFLSENRDANLDSVTAREALEVTHQQKLLEIERNKHQAERGMQIGTFQLAADLLSQFAGQSKVAALAVIAINKGLAIAQVVQATAAATMRAFSDLGPIAGAPAAASIQALGAVQIGLIAASGLVQAYQATQGGGSAAVPTFSANPLTGAPTPGAISGAFGGQPAEKVEVHLNVQGNIIGTQDFVDNTLIPALKDAINNRDFVIIGDGSRQAQNLTTAGS